ncbi:hypothetical protein L682_01510 [Aquipseudomonas alcaligenes OT 69]|nr:hypothetical protein L682_01510 [Pseudomonas alcaligenes OT 69]
MKVLMVSIFVQHCYVFIGIGKSKALHVLMGNIIPLYITQMLSGTQRKNRMKDRFDLFF